MNEITQRGIEALRAGDRATARELLRAAIKENPNDASAWLWMSGALDSDQERLACLEQVLRIDPENAAASRGIAMIIERRSKQKATGQVEPSAWQPEQSAQPPAEEAGSPAAPADATQPEPGEERAVPPAGTVIPLGAGTSTWEETAVEPEQIIGQPAEVPADVDLISAAEAVAASDAMAPSAAEPSSEEETTTPEDIFGAGTPSEGIPAEEPVFSFPAAEESVAETAAPEPARRRKRGRVAEEGVQVIFRTRPSVVPALIGFWVFLFGAIALGLLLREDLVLSLAASIGLGLILEIIVAYTLIRNMSVRYELTNQQLTLRYRGKRVRVPVRQIYSATCHQTFFQRILGNGDVMIDANASKELAHLRMRNIADCQKRVEQIMAAKSA